MATTEKLQNEILLKEETFLKEEKAKLTEQLKKLKVSFERCKQPAANSGNFRKKTSEVGNFW